MNKAGYLNGRHYSAYTDAVRSLKKANRYDEAVALLRQLVQATEAEARADRCGVAPWYYEQLAIIFSKQKRPDDELAILERYDSCPKAPGAGPSKLAGRLQRVRERLHRQEGTR
jgi:hypothetical protein